MRILIVDDEELVRDMLGEAVELYIPAGSVIDTAPEVSQAKKRVLDAKAAGSCYDLVFTDVNMPGEDGIALAAWLLKESPESRVVLMSALAQTDRMEEIKTLTNIRSFLGKPFELKALPMVVAKAME